MKDRKFIFPELRQHGHQVAVVRAGERGWYTWPCLLTKNQQQALDVCRQINQYIIEGKPVGDLGVCVSVMAFGPGYQITDNRVCSTYHDFEPGDHVRICGSIGFNNNIWSTTNNTAVVVQRHGGIKYTISRRGDYQQTSQLLWSYKGAIEILTEKPKLDARRPEMEDNGCNDDDFPF